MNFMLANIIWDTFLKGGPVMWPILLCLLAALAVVIERSLWWTAWQRRQNADVLDSVLADVADGRFAQAEQATRATRDPMLELIGEGLAHAHTSMLGAMQLRATAEIAQAEKRLWVLSTFITLAPLLGLLGTVTGIMHSFHFVGDNQLAATKVSGGIAEALIATACGLGIAILCLLPYNYFNRRLSQLRSQMERLINHFELLAAAAKSHGHDLEGFARTTTSGRVATGRPF